MFAPSGQLQRTAAAMVDVVVPQAGAVLDASLDRLWKAAGELTGAAATLIGAPAPTFAWR